MLLNCLRYDPQKKLLFLSKQESIPAGCVPPALHHMVVSLSKGVFLTETSPRHRLPNPWTEPPPPGTENPLEGAWEQAARQEVTSYRDSPPRPPWAEWLTHACENITLPQTSFAGGNEQRNLLSILKERHYKETQVLMYSTNSRSSLLWSFFLLFSFLFFLLFLTFQGPILNLVKGYSLYVVQTPLCYSIDRLPSSLVHNPHFKHTSSINCFL